jgi:hypothetical protein
MSAGGDKLRFALDHNFPAPVLAAFSVLMPQVDLVPLARIDGELAEHHTKRDRPQIWRLEVRQRAYDGPAKYLTAIAEKQKTTVQHLFEMHKLPPKTLARE